MKDKELLIPGTISIAVFLLISFLVFSGITQSFDAALALRLNVGLGVIFTNVMIIASIYGRDYFWVGIVALMLIFGDARTRILAVELAALFVTGIAVVAIATWSVTAGSHLKDTLGGIYHFRWLLQN